jgi:glycosyltransferase involved in cell wall biosynthesis
MDHFSVTTKQEKIKSCQLLGLPEDKLIISYLGSVGAWYMLDEMLELFSLIKKKYAGSIFLFITHSDPAIILPKLEKFGLKENDIKICEATRNQVPVFMKASDINISFIKPVYSKISSSPTKLGEVLAMGIPVIVNTGIGDIETIIARTDSGIVLKAFNEAEYARAVESIPALLMKQPLEIRRKAEEIFSLKTGVKKYKQSYENAVEGKAQ